MKKNKRLEDRRKRIPKRIDEMVRAWFDEKDRKKLVGNSEQLKQ
jgi:hypothetical protein